MKRALFVDFDGVLHPAPPSMLKLLNPKTRADYYAEIKGLQDRHFEWLPILVDLLEPHPDVAVIVHSSWRLASTKNEVLTPLEPLGRGGRLLDVTKGDDRYASVLAAVKRHGVTEYRILDDQQSPFQDGLVRELIHCPSHAGISHPIPQAALREWLSASA